MWAFAIVLAQWTAAGGAGPGWASARPPECAALDGGRGANVWERAKSPDLRKYCDLVASGTSKLAAGSLVADVLRVADEADRAMPGRAAPLVLRGRALAALGKFDDAAKALAAARAIDPRALDDASALHALARSLARTGRLDPAGDAYRALLPRASTLGAAERGAACFEAGLVAMAHGPAGLDEAVAALRQARRESPDGAQTVATLALALALDRGAAGGGGGAERDEARALLAERARVDPEAALADPAVRPLAELAGALGEKDALVAIGLEGPDPGAAREAWHRVVEAAPASPWIEHARAHEGALAGKRPLPRAARPAVPRDGGTAGGREIALPNGLVVTDLHAGTGRAAKDGDVLDVQYVGRLTDGTVFDSTMSHGGTPFRFTLGQHAVILGWEKGIVGMRVGGKRRIRIPPELGYGARGAPPTIPPSATLEFDVDLVGIR